MANGFNAGTYEIYWYKDQQGTPNSPQSPATSIAQSPTDKSFNIKKAAVLGIGVMVAKRAINTVRNEIFAATGNERLETQINNATKMLGYVGAIAIGNVVGAVAVATDVALSAVTYYTQLRRDNIAINIESELKGRRVNIASGSAYYD